MLLAECSYLLFVEVSSYDILYDTPKNKWYNEEQMMEGQDGPGVDVMRFANDGEFGEEWRRVLLL